MMFSPLSILIVSILGLNMAQKQGKNIDFYKGQCGENHEFHIYKGNITAVISATGKNTSVFLWEVECKMKPKFKTKCEIKSGNPPLETISSFHFSKENFYIEHELEDDVRYIKCSIIRKHNNVITSKVSMTDLSKIKSPNQWIIQKEEANELLRENETLRIRCPDHFILKKGFGVSRFLNNIVTKVEMKKNGNTVLSCENVFYDYPKDDEVLTNCTREDENIIVETYKMLTKGHFEMIDLNFVVEVSGETNSVVGSYECISKVTKGSKTPMCYFQMEHGWLLRNCENVTLINKIQGGRSRGVMEMEVKMENLTRDSRLGSGVGLDVLIKTNHEIECSINSKGREYAQLSRVSVRKLSNVNITVRCCTKTIPIQCFNSTRFDKYDIDCKESVIGNLREHQKFNNQVLFTLRCIGESYNIAGFASPLPFENWDLIIPSWECAVVIIILMIFLILHFSGQFLHNIVTRDQESSPDMEQPSVDIVEY